MNDQATTSTTYAVIAAGGQQFKVSPGDRIRVQKSIGEPGQEFVFDDVRVIRLNGEEAKLGAPKVEGATVSARVIGEVVTPKVIVFKKKRRKGYRRKRGHRQTLTEVEIGTING